MAQLLTCPGPTKAFPGFCPQGLALLRKLERNPRAWRDSDQALYEYKITDPLLELVCSVTREFARFARSYITPPDKAVFHIFGETGSPRPRATDKRHPAAIWAHKHAEGSRGACFYFHFTDKEAVVLGGVYSAQPDELLAYRQMLQKDYLQFRQILREPRLRTLFGGLHGEQLKHVPKGFPPDHAAADLLRRNQWYVVSMLDIGLLSTERLLPTLVKHFEAMAPLVEFLNRPLGHGPKPRKKSFGAPSVPS
jgi:uncharacterized protein (TIGR02453 family)